MSTDPRHPLLAASLAACLAIAGFAAVAAPQDDAPAKEPSQREKQKQDAKSEREAKDAAKAKQKWFEKLDRDDRAAVDLVVGYGAPELPSSAERLNADFADLKSLRGKVVIVQTFTSRNAAGLVAVEKAQKATESVKTSDGDLIFVAVHTPEAIDKAKTLIEKRGLMAPVVLDAEGAFCDSLGAYKRPVAFAIDRHGNIRYAGLSLEGITGAATELLAEAFDPSIAPKVRETPKADEVGVQFPTFTNRIGGASDLRGKPSPALAAEKWWNGQPNVQGKLTVVDFWATWCPPCRAAIPHMNEIAKAYPRDVAVVGITDETNRNFDEGCLKHRLSKSDFSYAIGLDPQKRMSGAFGVRAIPHVAAISADGVVRWQGNASELTPDVMRQLVAANQALVSRAGGGDGASTPPARWSRDR
ncbi:MAG: redoxin domain-containing protein [Planctomycetota bacterium]